MKKYARVLTIAGSDSGGGAGIQADIKAISATGGYAASAITAVTVQNTIGVKAVHPIPPEIVCGQIEAVVDDIGVDAVKIGMLHDEMLVLAVADCLKRLRVRNIVLDPVMVSTSGHNLIEDSAIESLKSVLVPMATVLTPNVPEAEILSGIKIESEADMKPVAKQLSCSWKVSVMMKAGHLNGGRLVDIFYDAENDTCIELPSIRINTPNTHGTGCTLSSAIASYLAQGMKTVDAVRAAKEYITKAIVSGAEYNIGHGHGPVNHFYSLVLR